MEYIVSLLERVINDWGNDMPDHKVHSSRVMMVLQFPDRGIREKKELPDRDDAELEITVDKLLC